MKISNNTLPEFNSPGISLTPEQYQQYINTMVQHWYEDIIDSEDFSYPPLVRYVERIADLSGKVTKLHPWEELDEIKGKAKEHVDAICNAIAQLDCSTDGINVQLFITIPHHLTFLAHYALKYSDDMPDKITRAVGDIEYIAQVLNGYQRIAKPEQKKAVFNRIVEYINSLPLIVTLINTEIQSRIGI